MNIATLIKASAKAVHAHRAAKRAHVDGASPEAQKKYQRAVIAALDELDPLVVQVMKQAAADEKPKTPFDWNGAAKAVIAGMKLVDRLKGASPSEAASVIEAEVLGVRSVSR